jgi:Bacterial capsule synthesis protein PGA_cap
LTQSSRSLGRILEEPKFLQLVAEIRGADVALANLEMVIHEFKGYAQQDSGGTYMAARPEVATELAWAGFDMVGHANNHTFDLSPGSKSNGKEGGNGIWLCPDTPNGFNPGLP